MIRYPERPLIFLSACYVGLSVGYLVRIVVGGRDAVACEANAVRYGAAPPLIATGAGAKAVLDRHPEFRLVSEGSDDAITLELIK